LTVLPETADRPYDVVLFGATGFTGTRAARRLAEAAPGGLRWALAGRREGAVREIAEQLGAGALVADAADADSVRVMARSARVVLSTVGPFARFGDPVVDACVDARTHYADLTGEVPWMRRVIERHHERARALGVRIVPASGFDSVPADLAVLVSLEEAARRGRRLESARTVYRLRGGLNGGTLASALLLFEDPDRHRLADPLALLPKGDATEAERRWLRDPRRPAFDDTIERWVAPFFMGPVNRRVVRRSIGLRAETSPARSMTERFRYDEYQSVSRGRGFLAAWATTLALGATTAALGTRVGRAAARRFGPGPGEGPSEEALARGVTHATTTCEMEGGGAFVVRQDMAGDPGNAVTVRCLVETGLALALDGEELGLEPGSGGVLTPSTAIGHTLVRRLAATGGHGVRIDPSGERSEPPD